MRRTDREIINPQESSAVIQECQVCRLALSRDGQLDIVPLSFRYDRNALNFHTAAEGMKIDPRTANPAVGFEFGTAVERIMWADPPCQWSLYSQSVIGTGTLRELPDGEEKIHGLHEIVSCFAGCTRAFYQQQQLENNRVWKLTIEIISGMRSAGKDGA